MTNATWKVNPGSNNFDAAGNWNPATVPDGTAIFGKSHTTALRFSASTTIGGWTFKANASHYSFDIPALPDLAFDGLTFAGIGIVVKGGRASIINHQNLKFLNSSTAGLAHIANHGLESFFGSSTAGSAKLTNDNSLQFFDSSTAGSAHFTNNSGGHIEFLNQSKAARAVIINKYVLDFDNSSTASAASIANSGLIHFNNTSSARAASIANNGGIDFRNSSTAGSATIKNLVIGTVSFADSSNAGHANITGHNVDFFDNTTASHAHIAATQLVFYGNANAGAAVVKVANGAFLAFVDESTGGTARLITKAGVTVDFSRSSGVGNLNVITVGSIEGAGHFRLGDNKLYVGSNNRSTKVSGAIDDGGSNGGSGAVLHKVGTGTLTLSHAGNTYSNGTVLTRGTLDVAAKGAAGPGSIDFDAGRQTLKIENKALANHAFSNVVTSFDTGDAIDLAGLKFVKHARATYDAGSKVLTVHSGKVTDTLTLIPAVLQFKAVDDGHGGTKIIARPPGAKPDALAARAHDSNQLRDGEHRAAGDSFHFKTFAERGEHGSSGRDFHPGAESAASDHSHDALQQTMTGGFHVDFAAGTASLIGQQHFVNPLHGDFIL